jgi:hypothetical protein
LAAIGKLEKNFNLTDRQQMLRKTLQFGSARELQERKRKGKTEED